jgi:hypothetical protein
MGMGRGGGLGERSLSPHFEGGGSAPMQIQQIQQQIQQQQHQQPEAVEQIRRRQSPMSIHGEDQDSAGGGASEAGVEKEKGMSHFKVCLFNSYLTSYRVFRLVLIKQNWFRG